MKDPLFGVLRRDDELLLGRHRFISATVWLFSGAKITLIQPACVMKLLNGKKAISFSDLSIFGLL